MFERSKRGGQAFVVHRSAKANHEGLPDYDPSLPRQELFSVDINAMYGGSMCMPLPVSDFAWLSEDELQALDLSALSLDDPIGFYLEVDLAYDSSLHVLHSDFPLAPEKMLITPEMYNDVMRTLFVMNDISPSSTEEKLIGHLGPRYNYVLHAYLLHKYVSWGLRVTKRHRGVRFRQERWLAPYMQSLATKRQAATTTFQSNLYKLWGNAVYGYSLKSNRHHVEVKLVRSRHELLKCTRKGRFKSATLVNPDFAFVELRPASFKADNPVSMGVSVLDLSKSVAYGCWFRLKECWGENIKMCYSDTDSFLCCVSGPKTVHQGFAELTDLLDLSSFPPDHPLHSMENFKVPLKLKVEHANKMMTHFYGVRSKVYTVAFAGDERPVKKAKGVPRRSLEVQVSVEDYAKCLEEGLQKSVAFRYLRTGNTHTMYTWESRKIALRNLDTKRVIQEDGVSTRPYFFNPGGA